jgi:hypothetical protein
MNKRVFNCGQEPHTAMLLFIHMMTHLEDLDISQLWSDFNLVMRRQLHTHEEFEKLMKGPASVDLETYS